MLHQPQRRLPVNNRDLLLKGDRGSGGGGLGLGVVWLGSAWVMPHQSGHDL